MSPARRQARLLMYSHDTFGLGHLRRCRAIAHSLVGQRQGLSVLILSGSPIIGSFDFANRVDFVRIPGVIKLRNGDYTSLSLDIAFEEILALRASIIRHTAEIFQPDIFLVDKEPLGLRGEIRDTLVLLKERRIPLVLGLRDILDDPHELNQEWRRKQVLPALEELYDHVWIYGLRRFHDPFQDVPVSETVQAKTRFTGYLRRSRSHARPHGALDLGSSYLLVTTGGGGDGAALIDWVLRAYEHDPDIPHAACLVLGPFLHTRLQEEFRERVARLKRLSTITFDAHVEDLIAHAAGVVAMGGYNTFCEILSFDRPALIVPRVQPRREQFIRASRAQALGLASMLEDDGVRDPRRMAKALRELPHQPRPSAIHCPGLLDGLSLINAMVDRWLDPASSPTDRRPPSELS